MKQEEMELKQQINELRELTQSINKTQSISDSELISQIKQFKEDNYYWKSRFW